MIKEIEIGFSEAPGHKRWTCKTLASANAYLWRLGKPDLGYWKTDFKITLDDGDIYEGRFDIGADAPTLEQHIIHYCKKMNGDSVFSKFIKEEAKPYWLKMQGVFERLFQGSITDLSS